jgi:hypothetical protein
MRRGVAMSTGVQTASSATTGAPARIPSAPLSGQNRNAGVEAIADLPPRNRVCLWHGLSLGGFRKFLSLKPQITVRNLDRLLSAGCIAGYNSLMNGIEHLIYGGRIARTPVTEPPIFILGHWRSGTTMLHNLMTLNPRFTFLNLYECLFPGHFLLTQKINAPLTEWLLPRKRPMDNVEVAWSAPQEDEVALAVWTTLSPYLMPAFQGRMNVYERFLDPAEMTEPERRIWKDALLTLVKKVAMRRKGICVMKSPTHTYRVPTLLEMFPDARFVYICRDPRAVYQSTIHLRKMMFAENTLGDLRPEVWSEETLYLYEKSVRRFEDTKHLIPAGNLFELRFEDLEQAPADVLEKLHASLNLPGWDEAEAPIRKVVSGFSTYRKNSYRIDADTIKMLETRLRWVFDLYGYSLTQGDSAAA